MNVVEQMLARYPAQEREHALREVMQEIALAGLQRGGFFDKAAFYGGTCLRIVHGLPRFSEDLDFSLLTPDHAFTLAPYFDAMRSEFDAFGFEVTITAHAKSVESAVVSAFVKQGTSIYDVQVRGQRTLKIKFEVDTQPPPGFATEERLLLQPYSFYAKCYALPDLHAGKLHALLFRKWKNRVKGRDWFDFEWYIRNAVPLHLAHLDQRARQSGDWDGSAMQQTDLQHLLLQRIESLDFEQARADVRPFLRDAHALDIWSPRYFRDLAGKLIYA
ncbi:nucleotidyl transferase AbiEii/AbiGii toxin family protein [Thermomonas sp. RSS23]|uniref:Nucleotidyl transferase AbiEii/AbiGii toxin family protein n=1 Tax=Thermomonas beijingensis TaxID=2872701 RepID=A0ABS7TCJ8_9GAMM|nr:nucleotidyl transferase AbiEii/AbiGii toxin family protein [Thermomonas beijingensis]